jgi:hypothetical protein
MMSAGYMDNERLSGGGYGGNGVDFGIYGGAGQASLNPWVVNGTSTTPSFSGSSLTTRFSHRATER